MELTNRSVRIIYVKDRGLLAADTSGRIHLLDENLNVVQSSPAIAGGQPIYAVQASKTWVVGKDRSGNILRWSLDTLDLTDVHYATTVCDPRLLIQGEQPTPKINRGIAVWNNYVYVNNGYMQLVVLNLDSFAVERIIPSPTGDAPIEWICTAHPEVHAISDKQGHLYFGNLDTMKFTNTLTLDQFNLHRVLYDEKHDRFWVTQDGGDRLPINVNNGIVIVSPDGITEQQIKFARDDVEFLVFTPGYDKAMAGGFDGMFVVFDNSQRDVRIERTITGFPHQLNDCALGPDENIYVLTQDGEILKFNYDGQCRRASFRRQAIWDIQWSVSDPDELICGTDDGTMALQVEVTSLGVPCVQLKTHHISGFGFTRRIVTLPDGYIGITRDCKVFRVSIDGHVRWHRELAPLLHTVSVSPDLMEVLVAADEGAFVLNLNDGTPIEMLILDNLPIWASAYIPSGTRVIANRHGTLCAFEPGNQSPKWRVELGGYPKRIYYQADTDSLFVVGGGGVREVATDGSGLKKEWNEVMENTCENVVLVDRTICAVTYGCQLLAYDYDSGELVGLIEDLPDFPKGLKALRKNDGTPVILVGGRGGYLGAYELNRERIDRATGALELLHMVYLPRPGMLRVPNLSVSTKGLLNPT